MNDNLIVTYRDIAITYDEQKDKWFFTLRGRDRSADSLANAKKAIDAPPPKEEKPFERFEAWYDGRYSEGYFNVNVTSVAEWRYWVSTSPKGAIRQG